MKAKKLSIAAIFLSSTFMVQQVSAQFILFDNFDSLTTGAPLDGQNGWTLGSGVSSSVSVSSGGFGSGNYGQVVSSSAGNTGATYKNGLGIAGSSTASTVFMQFSLPTVGGNVTAPNVESINFSIDQNSAPANSGAASSAEFNYDNNGNPNGFRIRNGGGFGTMASASSGGSIITPIAGATYDLWFVLNASAATYQVYLQDVSNGGTDGLTTPTLLWNGTSSTLAFRTGAGGNTPGAPLDTFDMGQGSNTGTVPQTEIDNIYVNPNSFDLSNPTAVPEPSTVALLGFSGLALFHRLRHRNT